MLSEKGTVWCSHPLKIFILSVEEAEQFFSIWSGRCADPSCGGIVVWCFDEATREGERVTRLDQAKSFFDKSLCNAPHGCTLPLYPAGLHSDAGPVTELRLPPSKPEDFNP